MTFVDFGLTSNHSSDEHLSIVEVGKVLQQVTVQTHKVKSFTLMSISHYGENELRMAE